jgi:DNA repair protein RecO (recombination protein O)
MSDRRKLLEPAWLLHHRPWSDTSRIVELMTRDHGRVTLFAHGARRPKSAWRPVLRPFVPLLVSWSGRGDGGTLTGAEATDQAPALPPAALLSGYYLNELLLKLLAREDRHEALYEAYGGALAGLAAGAETTALRRFERALLDELGYGVDLTREAGSGRPLDAERYYHFRAGHGVFAVREAEPGADRLAGCDLLAVARGDYGQRAAERAARGIYGAAIAHCLEGRGLASREVMLAMRRRGQSEVSK